jgi:hypothetical protein
MAIVSARVANLKGFKLISNFEVQYGSYLDERGGTLSSITQVNTRIYVFLSL